MQEVHGPCLATRIHPFSKLEPATGAQSARGALPPVLALIQSWWR